MSDLAYPQNDVNLDTIVDALGGWVKTGKAVCPICGGKLSVAEGHSRPIVLKCWGTCPDNAAVIEWLRERGAWRGSGRLSSLPVSDEAKFDWRAALLRSVGDDPLVRAYLRHRSITGSYDSLRCLRRAEAGELGLDAANWMLAEVVDRQGLCGIQLTKLASPPTCRVRCPKLSHGSIKGGWVSLGTYHPHNEIVIGEGVESVCSAMELLGVPHGRATLGAWNLPHQDVSRCAQALIAVDRDEHSAGEQAATKLAGALAAKGIKVKLAFAPKGYKDWNEYHAHR
jgi:Toprim domain-containing protein